MIRAVRLALVVSGALFFYSSLVLLTSCIGTPSTGGSGTASSTSDGGIASGDAATGLDCITEPTTGATLCTAVTSCPGVAVDHDVYPHCGFRLQGSVAATLDIECICTDGYLCPVGIPGTCGQATTLLNGQNETTVCSQISEGRCTPPPTPAGAATSSGSGSSSGSSSGSTGNTGASSTCDQTCASECVNDPTCLKMCGC